MVQDGSFPEGFTFRLLEEDDFGRGNEGEGKRLNSNALQLGVGYMECLSELTVVGEVNYEIFQGKEARLVFLVKSQTERFIRNFSPPPKTNK